MTKIDFSKMTAEERKTALAELQAAEQADAEAHELQIDTYKKMVNDAVLEVFPSIIELSDTLSARKRTIRNTFGTILDLKAEIYGTKEGGQQSHQFMDACGKRRIRIGYHVTDNWDDTVDVGIAKVKEYLGSLAKDEDSQILVDTILELLAKDAKGTLKASRVLKLRQMAKKSRNESFIEGVEIINDAYRPVESKSYVRAEYRDEDGAWVTVPLGMTEAQ